MASYRDKINQRIFKTEAGRIAWAIKYIEDHYEFKKELMSLEYTELPLFDDVSVWLDEYWSYHIVRPVEFKGNRYHYKIIPSNCLYSIESMIAVLEAQPWGYT